MCSIEAVCFQVLWAHEFEAGKALIKPDFARQIIDYYRGGTVVVPH